MCVSVYIPVHVCLTLILQHTALRWNMHCTALHCTALEQALKLRQPRILQTSFVHVGSAQGIHTIFSATLHMVLACTWWTRDHSGAEGYLG
jgi:hypothetical protein